ncbi:hypothetical protein CLHUN_39970 [Ruminiclostridium hungatei]|uniref:Uncharacterized protein n=1 Tax=Ruminiclostridium hungatei TaxID=48256 RepID=A0A1V4SDU3_RUMHU|nr:hypothetical protein [Ruminiclostridium hungatei]OPX42092.1 hypothetical protein CLHUN_39970 [Ruminiclostridium hungatei]
MSRCDELQVRLEKLESYVYNEVSQFIMSGEKSKAENVTENSNLLRYKPSKHQKAYKPERNLKKKCYTR